jgi:superfamily I DNA and/or RNA helicase
MLVRNYRSHSTLLQVPNRLFYGESLVAAGKQAQLLPPRWEPLKPRGHQEEEADDHTDVAGVCSPAPRCANLTQSPSMLHLHMLAVLPTRAADKFECCG